MHKRRGNDQSQSDHVIGWHCDGLGRHSLGVTSRISSDGAGISAPLY